MADKNHVTNGENLIFAPQPTLKKTSDCTAVLTLLVFVLTHSVLLSLFQRYYGKSLPFGKDSFSIPQIGLLTVEQALADYAVMITELKQQLAAADCPVIVFGGRYRPPDTHCSSCWHPA